MSNDKRILGQYYTENNPFKNKLFKDWVNHISDIGNKKFLEPFAGSNNIIKFIQEIYPEIKNWSCFDINPSLTNVTPQYNIIKQDTIIKFPEGYDVIVTNPPYLSKSSATRRGIIYPNFSPSYNDLYKICLDKMLNNVSFVAAIIPESFITSNLFHDRIFGIISLPCKMFNDTDCPVCLALFGKEVENNDFPIYSNNDFIGNFYELKIFDLSEYKLKDIDIKWRFNDPNGIIGVKCVDSVKSNGGDIYFHRGELIKSEDIKISSRAFTRISGLPEMYLSRLDDFIDTCNIVLNEYRSLTKDIFMTSFKGLRIDGKYRRRIDFYTVKSILDFSCEVFE
jgi:hypothetical protein